MDEQPAGNSSTSFGCLKDPKGVKKIKKVTEKQSDSIIVIKIVKHFGNIWEKKHERTLFFMAFHGWKMFVEKLCVAV